jgi:hypothetical protein
VSHLYLTCISPVSHLYLTCISPVSHLYLTCISPVSHLYLTCVSPVFHLYLTCAGTLFSCDFTTPDGGSTMCGITQIPAANNFQWTLWKGKVTSLLTGPTGAYKGVYYIFINTNRFPQGSYCQVRIKTLPAVSHVTSTLCHLSLIYRVTCHQGTSTCPANTRTRMCHLCLQHVRLPHRHIAGCQNDRYTGDRRCVVSQWSAE